MDLYEREEALLHERLRALGWLEFYGWGGSRMWRSPEGGRALDDKAAYQMLDVQDKARPPDPIPKPAPGELEAVYDKIIQQQEAEKAKSQRRGKEKQGGRSKSKKAKQPPQVARGKKLPRQADH